MAVNTPPLTSSRLLRSTPLAALAFAVLLTGCGGGSSKASAAAAAPTTTAAGGAGALRVDLTAFRDCMAKNGAPLPAFAPRRSGGSATSVPGDTAGANAAGGGGRGRGFAGGMADVANSSDPTVQKAYAACKSTLPAGFLDRQQKLTAYISCMKDHGVTITGGPGSGATPSGAPATTIDRSTPTFKAAQAVCGQLLPQRATGGGAATSTTIAGQ